MTQRHWIDGLCMGIFVSLTGCASHIDKVIPQTLPTMKQIYDEKTGRAGAAALRQREADIRARPISSNENYISDAPPHRAQTDQLFPPLPNPDLYMYVKPHVIGRSGAVVPAYLTRFTMYERTHYALPNEVIATIKHPGRIAQDPSSESPVNAKAPDPVLPSLMSQDHEH